MAEGKFVAYYRVSTAKQGRSGLGLEAQPYPQRARLAAALKTAQDVDTRGVSSNAIERGLKGPAIADAIRQARVTALKASLAGD